MKKYTLDEIYKDENKELHFFRAKDFSIYPYLKDDICSKITYNDAGTYVFLLKELNYPYVAEELNDIIYRYSFFLQKYEITDLIKNIIESYLEKMDDFEYRYSTWKDTDKFSALTEYVKIENGLYRKKYVIKIKNAV